MYLQLPIILLAMFTGNSLAIPKHTTPAFPAPTAVLPPGESYVLGYPLCGVAGYTEVPGNYTEIEHQESGSNLRLCLHQCRATGGSCKSIAYNADYTECLFYDQIVEGTQLVGDSDSAFVHWDLTCHV